MKITPVEIRQKTFNKKTLGGIDREEVAAYLNTLSVVWEQTLEENKELRIRLESAEREAGKLREVESTLYLTLKTAEETSTNLTEQAMREADLLMKEAHMKVDSMLQETQWKAKNTIEEAEEEARKTFKTLQQEIKELELEYRNIEHLRDNTLNDLRNLAKDINEKVDRVNHRENESMLRTGKASRQENVRQATTTKTATKNEPAAIVEKPKPVTPKPATPPTQKAVEPKQTSILTPKEVEPAESKSTSTKSEGSFFDQFN